MKGYTCGLRRLSLQWPLVLLANEAWDEAFRPKRGTKAAALQEMHARIRQSISNSHAYGGRKLMRAARAAVRAECMGLTPKRCAFGRALGGRSGLAPKVKL